MRSPTDRESETDSRYTVVLENVTKDFAGEGLAPPVHALRGVTLRLPPGSRVGIQGARGSGKSTLLHILGGLDIPTSGRILVDGSNLAAMTETERAMYRSRTVGYVAPTSHLIPSLTVRGNVELGMLSRHAAPEARRARAEALLTALGMADRGHEWPRYLTAEERRRVALAAGVAKAPTLLLADNLAEGLEPREGSAVIDLLLEMSRAMNITMILTTRDEGVAGDCDLAFSLRDGRIEAWQPVDGTPNR